MNKFPAIDIEHRFGWRHLVRIGFIASQNEDVANAKGGSAEKIALQGISIAVPASELEYRFDTMNDENRRGGKT